MSRHRVRLEEDFVAIRILLPRQVVAVKISLTKCGRMRCVVPSMTVKYACAILVSTIESRSS